MSYNYAPWNSPLATKNRRLVHKDGSGKESIGKNGLNKIDVLKFKWVTGVHHKHLESTLKIARCCPLVIQGFSNFLGLFQVMMANPTYGTKSNHISTIPDFYIYEDLTVAVVHGHVPTFLSHNQSSLASKSDVHLSVLVGYSLGGAPSQ